MESLNLPLLLGLAGALCVLVGTLLARDEFSSYLRETVAAVYRVALHAAAGLGGLEWLRSPEGIAYRRDLAARAYDVLPLRLGPIPIGIVKLWLSREQFAALVEAAFVEVVALAERLEAEGK